MAVTYPFTFAYSPKIQELFEQTPIFLAHHNQISDVFKHGEIVKISRSTMVEPYATMPRRHFMNSGAFSYSFSYLENAKIGRYCSISWGCKVLGIDHPTDNITTHVMSFRRYWTDDIRRRRGGAPTPSLFNPDSRPISIGNDVWIGQDVSLKPGISIGDGAVVASGAIVVKDVPPYAIVGGVPAKIIKYRLPEEARLKAQELEWWRYAPESFEGLSTDRPIEFLEALESRIANGLEPYAPSPINLAEVIATIL